MVRWFSTPESAKNREVSVLAVIETLLATSVTIWLAVSVYGNWTHVAIAACVAPLLLLRTEASDSLNMKWARAQALYPVKKKLKYKGLQIIVLAASIPAFFAACRALGIMVTGLRHPLQSIMNIPANWQRITLSTDFLHPPEIIPGIETESNLDPVAKRWRVSAMNERIFWGPLSELRDSETRKEARIALLMFLPVMLLFWLSLFLPSILYRLSLKSTAIVWLPLLWIIPKGNPKESLSTRLRLIYKSSWGRFVTLMSLFVLICFIVKLVLYSGMTEVVDAWKDLAFASAIESFVEPYSVPIWQVSSAFNSLLAIALYLFASHQLILLDAGEKVAARALGVDYTLRTASVIRTSLSLYTSLCLGYLVLHQAWLTNWPPLGDKFFPWQ